MSIRSVLASEGLIRASHTASEFPQWRVRGRHAELTIYEPGDVIRTYVALNNGGSYELETSVYSDPAQDQVNQHCKPKFVDLEDAWAEAKHHYVLSRGKPWDYTPQGWKTGINLD